MAVDAIGTMYILNYKLIKDEHNSSKHENNCVPNVSVFLFVLLSRNFKGFETIILAIVWLLGILMIAPPTKNMIA